MTYPLQSPGTSVTINDESMYASAGEGTVPLIVIGTHEFKTLPNGTGIATGTLPENAGKLYPITSQRELLQTFGNPIFYTRNGSSVHGYELNEYGLHAAYQYLGVANRAFVVRAGIDYGQLMPRADAPRGEAENGTVWLDTAINTWNFYEYTGTAWTERTIHVIENASQLSGTGSSTDAPLTAIGEINDFAIVVLHEQKVLYQKLIDTANANAVVWVVVGSAEWTAIKPTASLLFDTFLPATATAGDVLVRITPAVTTSLAAAATWLLKTYNITTGIWEDSLVPIRPLASESTLARTAGAVYIAHGATTATFDIRYYDGANWMSLDHVASSTEPTTDPADGTLWYNPNVITADIRVVQGGAWVTYATAYPDTDPTGVLLRGSAPATQSDGTPLVAEDLWIDTSDLENFPVMYRWTGTVWKKVNVADNIDPINGIAFGELSNMNPIHFAEGMKLFNLTASTNDVKAYIGGNWVNVSGYQPNGVPFFGRKAQRQMIVKELAEVLSSNEDIRAETVYFNLIAAPGYIELIDEMVTLNTDMKEVAFIVADTPARLQPTGAAIQNFAKAELSGTIGNTENGVVTFNPYVGMYYPWGLSTNVDGNEVMVPPSTIALRTMAYNDSVAYPWMAPAGFTRGLVTNAASVGYLDEAGEFKAAMLNQGQRDLLYQNQINPIAYIPNRGLVVYGQKTRHSLATSLDRINVARLINHLRYNLDNLSKPFLFEPNDQQTRDSVRVLFERYLGDLVGLRGLYDFVVVCDESNNTPERIDRNELWVDVAIQPVQAVEFIYIPVRILATGDDLDASFL